VEASSRSALANDSVLIGIAGPGSGGGAWPADNTADTLVDVIGDIANLTTWACVSAPPAPADYDIDPQPPDGFIDVINDIARLAGLFDHKGS